MSTTNQQKTQDKLAQLLAAKAPSYILCLNNGCSRREHCLRWLATAYAPETPLSVRAVNPRNTDVAAGRCPLFRDSKPLRMPLGLTSIYHDMPSRVERSIKNRLIAALGRKRYYEYHGGKRPVDPATESFIRQTARANGWEKELQFNDYIEDYLW